MTERASSPTADATCWTRFCGGVRHLAFLVAVVTAVGAVGWIVLQSYLNEEIRRSLEQRIARRLEGSPLTVKVHSARRVDGPDARDQGIEVRGVEVRDGRTDETLVVIDELWLACCCDLQNLLNQQVDVRHVTLRRPRIVLRGSWTAWSDWKRWFGGPNAMQRALPTIAIEEGTIEWSAAGSRSAPVTLRGLDVVVRAANAESLRTLGWPEAPQPIDEILHVRLSAAGDLLDKLNVDVLWNRAQGDWSVRGHTHGLRVARELLGTLPDEWSSYAAAWRSLEARGELTLDARSAETPDADPTFAIVGHLHDGRWADPRVPAPVTDLEADFTADQRGLTLRRLAGRCGSAEISATARTQGWRTNGEVDASLRLRRFELARAWIDLLPDELRAQWARIGVLGELDADLTAHYDGQSWRPDGSVVGRNLTALTQWFPYPLADGRGRIEVRGNRIRSHEVAFQVQGRPIDVDFDVADPGPQFTGFVTVKAPQAIPIDEQLLGAMEGKTAEFFRSLQPRGEVVIDGRMERSATGAPLERQLELTFRRGSVQYTRFPYPIEKIEGKVRLLNDVWQIGELTGRNDSAYIVARGTWTKGPLGGTLQMDAEAYDVALEEELRTALTPPTQRLWAQLQPRGTIDYVAIGVRYPNQTGTLGLDVALQKNPPAQNIEGRNVTLRPHGFPYQLDNLVGNLRYVDGILEIDALRAEHARTTFRARGRGQIEPDGRWQVQLSEFAADRLQLDHDLLSALPVASGNRISQLTWTGPLNIDGRITASGSVQAQEPIQAGWDVRVDIENGSVKAPAPIEQIRGTAQFVGGWNGQAWESAAELDVDSAFVRGVHVTQVKGPLRITPAQIVLGDAWSEVRRPDRPPRQVAAQLFGGQVATDAILYLGDEIGFRFQAGLQNASLQEMAREMATKRRDIQGNAFATLQMEGTSRGSHTWRGIGKVTCRDTNIQQLPVMSALLKPSASRRTEASSLALSDVDFSIQGDRIYFDRIDLKGDTLTLKGRGEMTLNRIVDLQFYTLVGRDDFWVPVVSPVLAEASRQMLEIRVTGPLETPVIDRKVVPAINDVFQQMFPELAARSVETPLINRIPTPRQFLQRGATNR